MRFDPSDVTQTRIEFEGFLVGMMVHSQVPHHGAVASDILSRVITFLSAVQRWP